VDQILHGRATTTEAVCRAIQHSQERLRALATRYGGNPKTAFKWRKGSSVSDLPTGPRGPKSSVLSVQEEVLSSGATPSCRSTIVSTLCRQPYPV
jgi:hypothetical protein